MRAHRSSSHEPATPCAQPKSHRYNARGERVDPRGGYYLIPANEFAKVLEQARVDKRVLNRFEFVPMTAPGALRVAR